MNFVGKKNLSLEVLVNILNPMTSFDSMRQIKYNSYLGSLDGITLRYYLDII